MDLTVSGCTSADPGGPKTSPIGPPAARLQNRCGRVTHGSVGSTPAPLRRCKSGFSTASCGAISDDGSAICAESPGRDRDRPERRRQRPGSSSTAGRRRRRGCACPVSAMEIDAMPQELAEIRISTGIDATTTRSRQHLVAKTSPDPNLAPIARRRYTSHGQGECQASNGARRSA